MQIQEIHRKKIAFKALDWGLGHVTRSLSVLKQLVDQNNELVVFGTKRQLELFSSYEIVAKFVELDEIQWNFNGSGSKLIEGLRVSRAILAKKKQSYLELEHFLVNNEIDVIISDHDYGFYSKQILSILMTHQFQLPEKSPWIVKKIHKNWMQSFNFIWIVDDEKKQLAANLSKVDRTKNQVQFIGIRSRFDFLEKSQSKNIDLLVVVSGPNPYSTQFLRLILSTIKITDKTIHIVCPNDLQIEDSQVQYAQSMKEADEWFFSAKTIVSRSGYSTLMDCEVLEKKGIFLATKGQLEQEYFAKDLKRAEWDFFLHEEELQFVKKLKEKLAEL